MDELNRDLENIKKDIQITRTEMISLEHLNKDAGADINKFTLEETLRIEKDFKKLCNLDKSEDNFLKQQLTQLNSDKIKLQQNVLILDSRVTEVENNVGFKSYNQ